MSDECQLKKQGMLFFFYNTDSVIFLNIKNVKIMQIL